MRYWGVRALDFSKPMLVMDDGGRHIAMLPSRGLRPAQLAPLASRQSTVLRTNATRKVRICEFHCPLRSIHTRVFMYKSPSASFMTAFLHNSQIRTDTLQLLMAVVFVPSPNCQPNRPIMSNEPAPVSAVEIGREPNP